MFFERVRVFVRTLRFRLMLLNAAAVALTAVATLVGMQVGVRRALLHEMDQFLLDGLSEMASMLEAEPIDALGSAQHHQTANHRRHLGRFVQVTDAQGRPLWFFPNDAAAAALGDDLPDDSPTSVGEYRIARRRIRGAEGKPLEIRVGMPLEVIEIDVARVDALSAIAAGLVLFVAPVLGYWLAGRVTTVLRDFIQRTMRLRPAQLHERLPIRGARDELDQLAGAFNGLLDRIASYLSRRDDFVANAAHELRTPVAAIRSTAEVALGGNRTTAEYEGFLEDVIEECSSLESLVSQLLLLSESEGDRLRIHGQRVPFDEIVQQSAEMFGAVASSLEIRLRVQTVKAVVEGNPQHLRQVINNLLDNALKFTPAGGRIDVALRVDDAAGQVRLTVTDTGSGISRQDLPHIFERFYRSDQSRSYGRGAGLGLSICQAVVEAHGGRLEVRSEPGQGATFTVTLPAVEARPEWAAAAITDDELDGS